jgi:hypothetical protein
MDATTLSSLPSSRYSKIVNGTTYLALNNTLLNNNTSHGVIPSRK